jgi:hypothetical protein
MADKENARYLIPFDAAQEKAQLLQELAGGKNALRLNQALEAVALGCGFERWRELAATSANSLRISAHMLADDHHVDAETLAARRALQVEAVRGVITCSYARAQELVAQWALSGTPHGLQTTPARAVDAFREGDNKLAIPADYREGDDKTSSSVAGGDSEQIFEELLNDALFAATQEPGPDESPYAPPSTRFAPVEVRYKKRRLPADGR